MAQPPTSVTTQLVPPTHDIFVWNGVLNRGHIMRLTSRAPGTKRLLIFADSFAGQIASLLSLVFPGILVLHTLSLYADQVDRFKPTHVLFEAAERFLRHLPTEGEAHPTSWWKNSRPEMRGPHRPSPNGWPRPSPRWTPPYWLTSTACAPRFRRCAVSDVQAHWPPDTPLVRGSGRPPHSP